MSFALYLPAKWVVVVVILLDIVGTPMVRAEKATPTEMRNACQNWLSYIASVKGSWAGSTTPQIVDKQEIIVNDTLLAYCYTISPKGYVVVPALKELPPIKVSSQESGLDVSKADGMALLIRQVLKSRFQVFLEAYGSLEATEPNKSYPALGAEHRRQWDIFAVAPKAFQSSLEKMAAEPLEEYGPLLTTSWHQHYPYNVLCPDGDGGRTLVGCVATASAQILAYHQWPVVGTGSHSYTWPGDYSCGGSSPGQTLSAEYFDEYDWANMPDRCGSCTQQQIDAVAELCYEVGVAYNMQYGVCGSGAYTSDALNVFPSYFRYSNEIDKEDRSAHNSSSWSEIIRDEMIASRPIQYRIYGHSIVCDGWRDTGGLIQYHMNYGWDDSHTAWYTIDNLYCPWSGCDVFAEFLIRYIIPERGVMFEADTTVGWVPMEVTFTGTSEHPVVSWMWNFGDGSGDTVTVDTISHLYTDPGMFNVSLTIDTGGDTLSLMRVKYIIALADTLRAPDIVTPRGTPIEVSVYGRNTVPLNRIVVPVYFSGTLALTYDSFSTAGCRTEYFETQTYSHYNVNSGEFTLRLETSSTSLPAGEGPLVKLYFRVPWGALEDTALISLAGYSTYQPEFSGSVLTYQPHIVSSVVRLTCCLGIRGNADGDIFDEINVADLTFLVDYLFQGGAAPPCEEEADADGSGGVNVADLTYLSTYLFRGGPAPPSCP